MFPNIQGIWNNRDANPNTCGATPVPKRGRSTGQDLGERQGVWVSPSPLFAGDSGRHRCPVGSHLACRWVSAGQGAGCHWACWDCWKMGEWLLRLQLGRGGSMQGFSTLFSHLAYRGWRLILTRAEAGFVPWDVQHPLLAPSALLAPSSCPPWDPSGCVSWGHWAFPTPTRPL